MKIIDFKAHQCMHCYKCVRYCDLKAIRIRDGLAEIMEEKCVLCGHCLHVCPQSAKTMASDLDKVKYFIRNGIKTVISLAPSYPGFLPEGNLGQVRQALLALGFTDVRETAEGAAAVTGEYARLLDEGRMEHIITTCCPSVNDFIEIYYPSLIPYLAPVDSPMAAHGKLLKKEYGPETKVVFAGPCIAKKKEAADPRCQRHIDAVLNFDDIRTLLKEQSPTMSSRRDQAFHRLDPQINRLYPVAGGVLTSVLTTCRHPAAVDESSADRGVSPVCYPERTKQGGHEPDSSSLSYRSFHIHGTKNCIELCESLMAGELKHCFVEMNMCTGGCAKGSTPLTRNVSRLHMKLEMEETVLPVPADPKQLRELTDGVDFFKLFSDRSVPEPIPTEAQIREILTKTGKSSAEDELNCGACGYFTCREKAIAVFQKKAELNMCIPYLHEKAESLSNLVMETSPNLILIVDQDMKILEYSAVGEKYFGKSRQEAMKLYLFELIDPADFQWVCTTHQSIRGKKVRYPEYGITAILNIVYVKKRGMALGTFVDITEQEKQAQRFYEKKLNTVALAQTVIRKQMTVAQEIAGLLGETAAETKTTLSDLCDSLLEDGDETDERSAGT